MKFINKISNENLDILKEIGNIGAGNAATSLSILLNKRIQLRVPNVRIMTFNEMVETAGGAENVVASVFLRIEGDAPSNLFFILSIKQANTYIQHLIGNNQSPFEKSPYDDLALSALQELGNILAGSYLSALSDFTGLNLYPSVPATSIDMLGAILSYGFFELSQFSDYAIVVDTALIDCNENHMGVDGHFFLLPDPESFDIIFHSLGVALDE
ncbi:chemotaxis protein CheC [Niallia sp. Krafla_26]|uniref:chemotaxis protein CheC n=1 Tax=Niallia sp. Krafla_26 TaxID=3064703 RepID=UPI003D16F72F